MLLQRSSNDFLQIIWSRNKSGFNIHMLWFWFQISYMVSNILMKLIRLRAWMTQHPFKLIMFMKSWWSKSPSPWSFRRACERRARQNCNLHNYGHWNVLTINYSKCTEWKRSYFKKYQFGWTTTLQWKNNCVWIQSFL